MKTDAPGFMAGLMQDWALTTDKFLDHAANWHGSREVVGRSKDGHIYRRTYLALRSQAKRISNALSILGISAGDRIGTLAMNGIEHLAAWYGITGIGAVCHTLNPRLFAEQLVYIINHAEDRLIFADPAFGSLLAGLVKQCPRLERVILLGDIPRGLLSSIPFMSLEDFEAGQADQCSWGGFDERSAAGLCYTSGTTGNPKGVLYSHRSNFLHALTTLQPDVFDLGVRDVMLALVPMYHANAWALTFSVPAVGAKMVMPGAQLDGASLFELIEQEGVTVSAGVPTVWLALLDFLETSGTRPTTLERVIIGGAACPERLITALASYNIEPIHAWGMTEMSPLGGVATLPPQIDQLPFEQQMPWRLKQGRSPCGIELKLVDDDERAVPHDGVSNGNLRVRGPGVASAYYKSDADILDQEGFLQTGDVATIDELGFVRITDRAKDLIKSGGEWISSIDIENSVLAHDKVALAAVIGVPDVKWGERPHLLVQLKQGQSADAAEMLGFLRDKIARWWLPDRVSFVETLPLGPTGKIDKKVLRADALAHGIEGRPTRFTVVT